MEERSLLEDRLIEFDGLAVVLLACAFFGVSALTVWVAGSAAQRFDPPLITASAAVGLAVTAAWVAGYPRRATIPAMALVVLIAMIVLPRLFPMDGLLLRAAAVAPASRLYVAIGLYVGGLGVAFMGFMVFGFLVPLGGAVLALRRQEKGARQTLILHCALTLTSLVLVFFPRAAP